MARYRRIIADLFIDSARPPYERRCCWSPTVDPARGRDRMAGVFPGMALVAGPDLLPGQEKWIPASSAPMQFRASTFAIAGRNPAGPVFIADVNTLAGVGMDDSWSFDAIEAIMLDGRALNVLVAAGANVVKGGGLTTDAVGRFVPAGAGDRIILIADETFNNNTGIYQHVRALPANGA